MNEEIKEILKQCDGVVKKEIPLLILAPEYTKILLDYITNLQQENKKLKELTKDKSYCNSCEFKNDYKELQEENERLKQWDYNKDTRNSRQRVANAKLIKENDRLKEIAKKMHLWIFLHSDDEQKIYDELGLTDEENKMLGYSGQFKISGGDEE